MSLIQKLPEGPLDIITDGHGEYEAFERLLTVLGYDDDGNHPDNRHLVFNGDMVDRGPDSPRILKKCIRLVKSKKAEYLLGNHELNILNGTPKDSTGWYFPEQVKFDSDYQPFT